MASPIDASTPGSRATQIQGHDWPGERNPTQWDVHNAHEVPEASFRDRFKAALLLSEDAINCHQYLTPDPASGRTGSRRNALQDCTDHVPLQNYTYPMAILSELPSLPDDDILSQAQAQFTTSFKKHVFLSELIFPDPLSNHIVPPYLKIGLACLGTAASKNVLVSRQLHHQQSAGHASHAGNLPSDLFIAGDGLWGVMMEVDNREARLFESVFAGSLYATYGILSADEEFWSLSSSTMAGTATMARRLRLHYEGSLTSPHKPHIFLEHNDKASSLLMSYLFLVDVIGAAHCDRVPCISTKELFMRMPSSPHNFHQMYSCLFSSARALPSDLRADEDSLLLLTGICADILFGQRSLLNVNASASAENVTRERANPYAPLSPAAETLRQQFMLSSALDRWHLHFGEVASKNLLSMFYFCRLLLSLPGIMRLPSLAGYPPKMHNTRPDTPMERTIKVSDEAVDFAWRILDCSNCRTDSHGPGHNVSIWLPIALFYASLTIWYHLQDQMSSSTLRTGTLRTLNMFKEELANLPWPCCQEMCLTLDNLASQP